MISIVGSFASALFLMCLLYLASPDDAQTTSADTNDPIVLVASFMLCLAVIDPPFTKHHDTR